MGIENRSFDFLGMMSSAKKVIFVLIKFIPTSANQAGNSCRRNHSNNCSEPAVSLTVVSHTTGEGWGLKYNPTKFLILE